MPKTAVVRQYPIRLFAVPGTKRCRGREGRCWGYFRSIDEVLEACGPGAVRYPYSQVLPLSQQTDTMLDMPDGSKRRYRRFATWRVVSPRCGHVEVVELELLCDPEICQEDDQT